jgi:hypothetical protein
LRVVRVRVRVVRVATPARRLGRVVVVVVVVARAPSVIADVARPRARACRRVRMARSEKRFFDTRDA